jgi:hypothetical protein
MSEREEALLFQQNNQVSQGEGVVGSGISVPTPQAPLPQPAQATGMKSLADLGYTGNLAQAFTNAGITEMPEWMGRYKEGNWNYSDLINDYKTIRGADPSVIGVTGKANDVLSNMGWSLADQGLHYVGTQPIAGSSSQGEGEGREFTTTSYTPSDPAKWSPADQDYFEQSWMGRKQAPNVGAWEQSIKPAMMGIGSIISMAAAPYLAGAGAAVEGGLAAAEGGAISTEATMAIGDMMAYDAGVAGTAAGADVGMGAGTSWMTDMGWPASYGFTPTEIGNYLAGTTGISGLTSLGDVDWTKLGTNLGSTVLGGAAANPPTTQATSSGGGQGGSAGNTSPIQSTGFNATNPITPAAMPTGSVMGAFAPQKDDKNDYMKYFSTLF